MKTYSSYAPFLIAAAFLSLSASFAFFAKQALSFFSIAAQSSERHANAIAGDTIVCVPSVTVGETNFALFSCAGFNSAFQSQIPAEVC